MTILEKARIVDEIQPVLRNVKEYFVKRYGERLEEIILFGSFARGEANEDSDIDIALVWSNDGRSLKEEFEDASFSTKIIVEYKELLNIVDVTSSDFKDSDWSFYANLREEEIKIWTRLNI